MSCQPRRKKQALRSALALLTCHERAPESLSTFGASPESVIPVVTKSACGGESIKKQSLTAYPDRAGRGLVRDYLSVPFQTFKQPVRRREAI